MATATLHLRPHRSVRPAPTTTGRTSTTAATVLSVLGSVAAIGIAAIGLLVVPVAALIVFGPALFAAF
ncbi:hypothetical protein AB3M83_11575 [Microbacterium sp. 179-B 1A2 NHS]|uniref:hypothetical protein n=1 Tax=Microbacterium sp. 179-B 1A2 NHS TaxID=3142383 RepID=UPI0039A3E892